jgi:hypothetical protein
MELTLTSHLPIAVRKRGTLYCPACLNPDALTHETLSAQDAQQAAGATCPRCERPVRADEREPFYLGSEFIGSEAEYAIDGVLHEQALDFFVSLSIPELRKRQYLTQEQIGLAWARREHGQQMEAILLRLQATHGLLSAAVMRKTEPGSPWATLKRRSSL